MSGVWLGLLILLGLALIGLVYFIAEDSRKGGV